MYYYCICLQNFSCVREEIVGVSMATFKRSYTFLYLCGHLWSLSIDIQT